MPCALLHPQLNISLCLFPSAAAKASITPAGSFPKCYSSHTTLVAVSGCCTYTLLHCVTHCHLAATLGMRRTAQALNTAAALLRACPEGPQAIGNNPALNSAAALGCRNSAGGPERLSRALLWSTGGLLTSKPAITGSRGLASAADADTAPCERQPERAQRNELDGRLEEAAKAGSAEAVLALIDQEGEHFTEQNVATALAAVAEACSATAQAKGKGGKRRGRPPSRARSAPLSPQDIVRSSAFQALVGAWAAARPVSSACESTAVLTAPGPHDPPGAGTGNADMVLAGMMRLEPRLLAEAVRSCGQLGARCA